MLWKTAALGDEFHLAAIVQNLKTLALRTLRPSPIRQRAAFT